MHPIYCDIYFVLPSAFDILRYILSCRAIAIYDLPINLRYIYKRVSPLRLSMLSPPLHLLGRSPSLPPSPAEHFRHRHPLVLCQLQNPAFGGPSLNPPRSRHTPPFTTESCHQHLLSATLTRPHEYQELLMTTQRYPQGV